MMAINFFFKWNRISAHAAFHELPTLDELLTSHSLDLKIRKNPREQPFFFVYIQEFSGYIILKVLDINRKKYWLFPRILFYIQNQAIWMLVNWASRNLASDCQHICFLFFLLQPAFFHSLINADFYVKNRFKKS